MKKENSIASKTQTELSLPNLRQQILTDEEIITRNRRVLLTTMAQSCLALLRQGRNLLLIKAQLKHGEFLPWIKSNLPFTERTVQRRMGFYLQHEKDLNTTSLSHLNNPLALDAFSDKELKQMLIELDIFPTTESEQETNQLSISIPPIIQRLTWVAEWTGRNADEINTWEPQRREELKLKLKPIVEIYERL